MIRRCFQSDLNLGFARVGYRGRLVNYFGGIRRYAPPDQYSLNFAYEHIRQAGLDPCCLFFCTLNSHYPWHSPTAAVDDWRTLDDTGGRTAWPGGEAETAVERYLGAIRYQLDYVLGFVAAHADEDLLVVVFGDHQPPFLTQEHMGKHTPVHVIGKNAALMDVFYEHGFLPALNVAGRSPREIKHEGFLSLLLKGMQAAYGTNDALKLDYKPNGATLFDAP
jgi:hypothetical protein